MAFLAFGRGFSITSQIGRRWPGWIHPCVAAPRYLRAAFRWGVVRHHACYSLFLSPPFFFETQMLVGYLLILEKLTTPDKNGAVPELFTRAGLAPPHSTVSRQRLARPLPPSGLFRPMGGARTDQGRQRRLCVKGTALGVEMWGRQRLLIGSAAFLV